MERDPKDAARSSFDSAFFEKIVNALPQPVFVKNVNSQFTYANEAFLKLLAASAESIVGKSEWDLYDTALAERYSEADRKVIHDGLSSDSVEIHRGVGGEIKEMTLRTVKVPLVNDKREVIGLVGTFEDISNQADLEAELRRKVEQLADAARLLNAVSTASQVHDSPKPTKAFISYRHENAAHTEWVRKFASDLIERHEVDCILDQFDLDYGDSIQAYMHRIERDATHFLLIITPECVKAVEKNSGGVAFEIQLATALRDTGRLRVIPVLRAGSQTPSYVKNHLYIDFRDADLYFDMLKRLADSIHGRRKRPSIAQPATAANKAVNPSGGSGGF